MSPEFFPDGLERSLGMGVDGLFEFLGQLIDLELCPEGKMVADFLLPPLGLPSWKRTLEKGTTLHLPPKLNALRSTQAILSKVLS